MTTHQRQQKTLYCIKMKQNRRQYVITLTMKPHLCNFRGIGSSIGPPQAHFEVSSLHEYYSSYRPCIKNEFTLRLRLDGVISKERLVDENMTTIY